ncbi:AAA family ATPase [Streptomyces sp. A7024]|uniref:AAA family ATPase n=1 Tax=Streptomyces coryli TaxID=1128680 RepID=A0A6G4U9B2_9ACTN|nr:AAA family ATPase [Streptomyces coryli]NGN68310.1 AAA family ATPase [Streptomyces coryli]
MLVSRKKECAHLVRLLRAGPQVLVVGPAGCGKSAVAAAAAQDMGGAVVRADLSQVADPAGLVHAVNRVLGPLGRDAHRPDVLIAEDCERLTPGCTDALTAVTVERHGLRVVATSRRRLPGMLTMQLDPLPPAAAAAFFARAAERHGAPVAATEAARTAVDEVCTLLDGRPLALNIAAAQLRRHPLPELPRRLLADHAACLDLADDRTGPAPPPPHHRSLRRAITVSHRLCSRSERRLWARLSVFPREFTVPAAWRVCADERLTGAVLLQALRGLQRDSVVEPVPDGVPGTRYRLPPLERAYGADRLARTDEESELRRRCKEWSVTARS